MGVLLAFPAVYLDYTGQFAECKQQTFRSLSDRMKTVVRHHEIRWGKKLQENTGFSLKTSHLLDQVYPQIWIGTADSYNEDILIKNGISVVLNMARECDYKFDTPMTKLVKIGIDDGKLSNVGVFEKAAEVIADAVDNGDSVLVHCAAGVSRSCASVIAYLMLYKSMGWTEALEKLREHRPCVNPHPLLARSFIRDFDNRFIP